MGSSLTSERLFLVILIWRKRTLIRSSDSRHEAIYIPAPFSAGSPRANHQISCGIALSPSRSCLSDLRHSVPCRVPHPSRFCEGWDALSNLLILEFSPMPTTYRPLRLDFHCSPFPGCIMAEAAPGPILRVGNKSPYCPHNAVAQCQRASALVNGATVGPLLLGQGGLTGGNCLLRYSGCIWTMKFLRKPCSRS